MKFCLSTIAIYLLLFVLLSTLCTYASQEDDRHLKIILSTEPNIHKERNETLKIVTILKHSISQEFEQTAHLSKKSLLLEIKNNLLYVIINQFLTIKDILILQKTCESFQHLLQPNHANMMTFCNYGDAKKIVETIIIWDDLKYFLKQNYYSAFNKMKMYNIKEYQYLVLTRASENQIIIWNNNFTPYPQILLHQTQNTLFANQQQNYFETLKFFNKRKNAWAIITKEGNVTTGGEKQDGGDSSMVQFQLQKIKMIVSTFGAFASLSGNGCVVAWGNEDYGGKIPDNIQPRLRNVKMIFSTFGAFSALMHDGSVLFWGMEFDHDKISDNIQPLIFSTNHAFAALTGDGSVVAWGNPYFGGKIPDNIQHQLQNVKMIISNNCAFAALLNDGCVITWGYYLDGGKVPDDIQLRLNQNVRMIFSVNYAFCALLNDGSVVAWGNSHYGGKIPDSIQSQLNQNVKMIFSTFGAFAALLNDGNVLSWGSENYGGKIPHKIQTKLIKNVKTIFPKINQFTALCKNGEMFTWGES